MRRVEAGRIFVGMRVEPDSVRFWWKESPRLISVRTRPVMSQITRTDVSWRRYCVRHKRSRLPRAQPGVNVLLTDCAWRTSAHSNDSAERRGRSRRQDGIAFRRPMEQLPGQTSRCRPFDFYLHFEMVVMVISRKSPNSSTAALAPMDFL